MVSSFCDLGFWKRSVFWLLSDSQTLYSCLLNFLVLLAKVNYWCMLPNSYCWCPGPYDPSCGTKQGSPMLNFVAKGCWIYPYWNCENRLLNYGNLLLAVYLLSLINLKTKKYKNQRNDWRIKIYEKWMIVFLFYGRSLFDLSIIYLLRNNNGK